MNLILSDKFEIDLGTFEIDMDTFEIDLGMIEIDLGTIEYGLRASPHRRNCRIFL